MSHAGGDQPAPDGAPRAPTAGVEPAVLGQLVDVTGLDVAHEVVALYHVTAAEKVAAVVQGAAADAPARVLAAAHSLASCAGAVGAVAVVAHARAIEVEAAAARLPTAAALAALEQDFADSGRALAAVLETLAASGAAARDDPADSLGTEDDVLDEDVTRDGAGAAAPALAAP